MPQGACVMLEDRAVLAIAGPDARDFLQGLLSNDVRRLAPGRALYAALLTPQGKFLFDMLLVERGGRILLDVEAARRAELLQRLLLYRLRAKVAIDALPDWRVVALPEPRAAGLLGLAVEAGAAAALDDGVAFVDPRLAALGVRLLLPEAAVAAVLGRLELAPVPAETYARHRLRLGVPASPTDLVVQRSTLLESNFAELNGVAFDKGCFIGQELTARMHHRGLVRKRLLPVRIEGPCPAPGTPLLLGEREAGEMRSGLEARGIALARLELLGEPGTAPPVLHAGATRLTPEWPDWLPRPGG
jgi:folate-binding protein YgfZ